jgi:wobble nucleotide-excising tRNase
MAGSIEGVVANAEELVRTHLELHQQHINEDWLAVGAKVGSESCPFCGQPVPASDLVGAYRVFFSQAYRETKSRATRLRELVRKNFQEQQIQALKHLLEKNVALEEQWKQRGLPGMDGSLDPTQVHQIMMQLRNEVLKCLQEKEKAPLEPVEIDASCTQAMTNFMELEAAVQTYQQALREMKTRVEKYKSELPGLNLPELRERLSLLQNTQQRHRPEVAAVVAQLQERRDHKKTLTREKTAAKQSLDEYTANVFAAHEKRVNQHLEKAGAGFRIIETTTSYQGGKPRSDYKFAVDGHHVQLAGATPNASGPTFRTALSEGDKSTLAFGFFLSTLEQTAHLDKTLIVIDDPLTSLDSGRRAYTRSEILRLSARCKQLIVLTHDPMFGHSLAETNPQQVATLEIKRFKFGSQIQNWDSSLAIQEPYFRMFNDLVAYLDTDYKFDPLTIMRHLRPVVEGTIRYRIPGFKLKDATLGKYIALIREATLEHPLRTLKSWLEELDAINAYCVSKNHDDPNADRIDEQELRQFVSRVLSFVEGIGFGQTVEPD